MRGTAFGSLQACQGVGRIVGKLVLGSSVHEYARPDPAGRANHSGDPLHARGIEPIMKSQSDATINDAPLSGG